MRTAQTILAVPGIVLVLTALLARRIGLDHDAQWGIRRLLALALGLVLCILAPAIYGFTERRRTSLKTRGAIVPPSAGHDLLRSHGLASTTAPGILRARLCAAIGAAMVTILYVWYVSVGYWYWWPKTTHTYDLLGTAFRDGQLSLEEQPPSKLLALPDPYDPGARDGISFLWDASLYNGRYYLYWGPVPGLMLAFIKLFYTREIADQYLVFGFVLGIFLISILLALSIWRRCFAKSIPPVAMLPAALVLGLVGPAAWLLNRPAGYEAAIAGGQFFLMAGAFITIATMLDSSPSVVPLLFIGIAWVLAAGSRVTTILAGGTMTLILLAWMARPAMKPGGFAKRAAALLAPMALGAVALGWYNWARFGSPGEFGLRYQLTVINFRALYGQAFSIRYVQDNVSNYLLNPVGIERAFPFLIPLAPQHLPDGPALVAAPHDLETVAGLLITSPILVLALVPLSALIARGCTALTRRAPAGPPEDGSLSWSKATLLGSALASFAVLVLYFYPTMRQLEDVVPTLGILAVIGWWEGWRWYKDHRPWNFVFAGLAIGLALFSIVSSCLLAVTSTENRFLHLNRELLRQLVHFFRR
jgi:hypothetical protein